MSKILKNCNYCQQSHQLIGEYWYFCAKTGRARCKQKIRENHNGYHHKNRDKNLARMKLSRRRYLSSPEKQKEYSDRFYKKNRARCIVNAVRSNKKRLANNVNAALALQVRNRINQAIKRESKSGSALDYLGTDILSYKGYLESKFRDGMCWENRGKDWHIDHIKPVCSFNLEIQHERKKAFHYLNTQPLLKKENLEKGARCQKF